jgi:hypothetical protein
MCVADGPVHVAAGAAPCRWLGSSVTAAAVKSYRVPVSLPLSTNENGMLGAEPKFLAAADARVNSPCPGKDTLLVGSTTGTGDEGPC